MARKVVMARFDSTRFDQGSRSLEEKSSRNREILFEFFFPLFKSFLVMDGRWPFLKIKK